MESAATDDLAGLFVGEGEGFRVEKKSLLGEGGFGARFGMPTQVVVEDGEDLRILGQIGPFVGIGLVVVKLHPPILVANEAVTLGADRDMTVLFDDDGRSGALLVRVPEPRDKANTIEFVDPGKAAEFDEGREEVDEADGFGAALPWLSPFFALRATKGGRRYNDERYPSGFFPEGAFVPVALFAEMPAVVGPKDDDGVFGGGALL